MLLRFTLRRWPQLNGGVQAGLSQPRGRKFSHCESGGIGPDFDTTHPHLPPHIALSKSQQLARRLPLQCTPSTGPLHPFGQPPMLRITESSSYGSPPSRSDKSSGRWRYMFKLKPEQDCHEPPQTLPLTHASMTSSRSSRDYLTGYNFRPLLRWLEASAAQNRDRTRRAR
jgi:hypothetical protein